MFDLNIYKEHRLSLEEKITTTLDYLSVPYRLKGYKYLVMAIKIAIEEPKTTYAINKQIFPRIAEEYNTTVSCVESAVRNAISQCWIKGDYKKQRHLFGMTIRFYSGRPTDAEFIATLAKTISLGSDLL